MRIEGSAFGSAPVDDPRCYPGQIPGYSYLLVRDAVYPLEAGSTGSLLEALGASLLRLGVAPLEHRHPVLFYGSNAAPAQLARKYATSSAGFVVPAVLAVAQGLDVVYSSHVSPYGAVPATLIASPGPLSASTWDSCPASRSGCSTERSPTTAGAPLRAMTIRC